MTMDQIFADACPEEISITEMYRCRQFIAQKPSLRMADGPSRGEIRVVVPYGCRKGFSAAAIRAVEDQLTERGVGAEDIEAQIGHLLFAGTEGTDLDRMLSSANRFGAVPLRIPVSSREMDVVSLLRSDSRAARVAIDYVPQTPDVPPVMVEMDLMDSDAASSRWIALRARQALTDMKRARVLMTERPERERRLLLKVEVLLVLPSARSGAGPVRDGEREDEPDPRVTARVATQWPTVPTPGSVRLHRPSRNPGPDDDGNLEEEEVFYDPATRSLHWPPVELFRRESRQAEGPTTFSSGTMYLEIRHGEDLYRESCLNVQVGVEVVGLLLSGLRVAAFGTTGARSGRDSTYCRTYVSTDVVLELDDAIQKWIRSPIQHLRFEHVILDPLRIQDVRTALEDRGFEVLPRIQSGKSPPPLIQAQRTEGADSLRLWVFLEGKEQWTERKTAAPGGQTFTTRVESGTLTVYVRGLLKGAGGPVLEEIHYLHERLRYQFLATTDRR